MEIIKFFFEKLIGQSLSLELLGLEALDGEDFTDTNWYGRIAAILLLVSLVLALNYYKGFFNGSAMFRSIWVWLLNLLVAALISSIWIYNMTYRDFINGEYYSADLVLNQSMYLKLGAISFLYSAILFFVYSMLLKRFSQQNSKIPF